jgi:hypothetical protein
MLFGIGFLLTMLLGGCASLHHSGGHTTTPPPTLNPFQQAENALQEINTLMGIVYALSIACVGLGIVLMFYLKTSIGPALIAGGIGTLVLCLFVKTLIWFIPWIAVGVAVFGAIAFGIDVEKRGFKNALLDVETLLHIPHSDVT